MTHWRQDVERVILGDWEKVRGRIRLAYPGVGSSGEFFFEKIKRVH